MTPYENVFNRFLHKIEDPELATYSEDDQNSIMIEFMNTALANMELEGISLTSNLNDRDNDLMEFTDDLTNMEIELLAIYMNCAWLEQKMNGVETTLMFVGTNNEKWTDQKGFLESLRNQRDSEMTRARKLYRNYGYKHSDYFDEVTTNES